MKHALLALLAAAGILAAAGCYDASKVPPCDPRHPDPTLGCFARPAPDAGPDGARD